MAKTKMFMLREAKRINRSSSKLVAGPGRPEKLGNAVSDVKMDDSPYWVPHPRTGIYFPKGHESVMEDVPEGAASLNQFQTYWMRNVDGVEKPDPNTPHDHDHFLTNNF
ncbi:hypothetical protein F2P56_028800 [Juglans regia]|uniref:Late embryogenesis abundant protein Lea5-like n=2 Tax=Juglans regia TaxID=51240 RepID=A0A833SVK4_JUGRE|nr:uncharacterized protein LOC108996182 [Juglans regia]KAF5448246.1 hypothetical protein F2P56_028800 [Juglans regia]